MDDRGKIKVVYDEDYGQYQVIRDLGDRARHLAWCYSKNEAIWLKVSEEKRDAAFRFSD